MAVAAEQEHLRRVFFDREGTAAWLDEGWRMPGLGVH